MQGPESSTVGFGALGSLARPGLSFGSQFRGAPPCFIFGWLRPKPLQLPLPREGCRLPDLLSDAEGIRLPDPFHPLSWRAASQTARFVLGAPPPGRPWGWGWVGEDFCFGGRRAEKAHYKS